MQMRYLMCNVPLCQGVTRRRKVPFHFRGRGPALDSFANVTILRDFSRHSLVRGNRCFDGLKPRSLDLAILSVGTFLTAFLAPWLGRAAEHFTSSTVNSVFLYSTFLPCLFFLSLAGLTRIWNSEKPDITGFADRRQGHNCLALTN
jgi:hypothetical protein